MSGKRNGTVPGKQNSIMSVKSLGLDDLIDLQRKVDKLIGDKLESEKRTLIEKLARIKKYERRKISKAASSQPETTYRRHRRKIVPKYRDPESGQTWAGRGKLPRWLAAAVNNGANREDFRIQD
jgi:DNA-binding protein H-NS